jgi:hypothetical protein
MLVVDGVEYNYYFTSSEDDLEDYIEINAKRIFGNDSLYFSVKKKLKSLSGIGSIPDAYAIDIVQSQWYLVEVELSTHPIFEHIVPQLNKFVQGIKTPRSRKDIVEVLYNEIRNDPITEAYVRTTLGSGEIYRFLSTTIDKSPVLVVIIDNKTRELEEACNSIPINEKRILEFKIYERVDAGIQNAFLIDTLTKGKEEVRTEPTGPITPQPEYTIPILESLIELGGSGRVNEVLVKIYSKMRDRLKPADLEPLPSGKDIRWKNHARWQRYNLKEEGYLKSDSPSGIWEISEKGRDYLQTVT